MCGLPGIAAASQALVSLDSGGSSSTMSIVDGEARFLPVRILVGAVSHRHAEPLRRKIPDRAQEPQRPLDIDVHGAVEAVGAGIGNRRRLASRHQDHQRLRGVNPDVRHATGEFLVEGAGSGETEVLGSDSLKASWRVVASELVERGFSTTPGKRWRQRNSVQELKAQAPDRIADGDDTVVARIGRVLTGRDLAAEKQPAQGRDGRRSAPE